MSALIQRMEGSYSRAETFSTRNAERASSPLITRHLSLSLFKWRSVVAMLAVVCGLGIFKVQAAVDQNWRTDGTSGTWTGNNWSTTPSATGGTAWTSGNNAVFTANSTVTFASTAIGNVTVSAGQTVTVTAGGSLTLAGVRTFDVGSGATLTWTSQGQLTSAGNEGAGIIKNSGGILSLGAISSNARYDGGFTLNAGTVIVTGASSFGTGALAINGGTLQTSGGITFSAPSSVTIGGNFAFAGTGNDIWNPNVNLGASTWTITNNTTGTATRTFSGIILGGSGAGLTFTGTGGSGGVVLANANTYTGDTTISGGKLVLSGLGSIANSPNIILASGTTLDVSGLTAALILASSQSLQSSASSSTATLTVSATKGLTTAPNSPIKFTAYNGSTTPLTISGAGTLTLQSGNPVIVTVAHGGIALGTGDYKLIAKGASGTVSGTPTSITVNGDGVSGTASLVNTSGELFLHVAPVASSTEIQVETAADGSGIQVSAQNITAGSSITVYAIKRNTSDSSFVANVAADSWLLATKSGGVVNGDLVAAGDSKSAIFTGHLIGTATIRAIVSGSSSVDSGLLTVIAGTATQVLVETAANGSGTVVPTQNVFVGNSLNVFAITRDEQGNFVANVTANAWSLPTKTGGVVDGDLVPSVPATNAVFTGHTVGGTATIHATSGALTTTDSGTLTVVASTKKWDGGTSGTSISWATSTTWNPDGVPTSGYDDIVMDNSFVNIPTSITISGATAAQTITFSSGFNGTSTTVIGNGGGTARVLTFGSSGTGVSPLLQDNASSGTVTFQPQNGGSANLSIALGASGSISVASGATVVLSTVISEVNVGTSLTKTGNGILTLGGADTYTGSTTVSAGTLLVNGSLAAGSAVTVSSGTLGGSGTVNGTANVQSGGTLSPGNSSIATLTFTNGLTLAGTTAMDINKSGVTLTADEAAVTTGTTLTYGGTLTVTANGDTLASGDSFTLFTAGTFNGWFSTVTLPVLSGNLFWNTNGSATTGILSVYSFTTNAIQTMSALSNTPTTLLISKVLAKTTGGIGILSLVSAANGTSGTVATNATSITYISTGTFVGEDSFNCVVSDTNGSLTTVTVTVTVNAANVGPSISPSNVGGFGSFTASGIPSTSYTVQISTDMTTWTDYDTVTTASNGLISYTDSTSIAGHGGTVFYRLKQQ